MNSKCTNCGVGLEIDDSAVTEPFNCPACGEFNDAPMAARAPQGVRISSGVGLRGGALAAPSRQGSGGNVAAALASFLMPGLGQLTQGRMIFALFFFLLSICCGVVGSLFLDFPMSLIPSGVIAIGASAEAAMWDGRD